MISRQPAGRFTPKFACRRTPVPGVSSPLLGVSVPWGQWNFRYYGSQWGILHFGGFWAISQQRVHGSTPNFICIGTMSAYVPLPAVGSSGPWGRVAGKLKTKKNGGWSHSCIGQLPFLFFSAMPNVVQYVGHRPAHILAQNRRDRPRRWKFFSNFSPFWDFTSIYLRNY